MENYEFGASVKPSCSLMHPIECAKAQSVLGDLYVRATPGVPAGSDRRLYDFGNFQIASNGCQGTSVNLGELWVTYEIELFKPKVISEDGYYIPYAFVSGGPGTTGTVNQGNPLGSTTGGLSLFASNAGTVTVTNTPTAITFKNLIVADYNVVFTWQGSAAVYAVTDANVSWAISGGTIIQQDAWPDAYNTQADAFIYKLTFRVSVSKTDVVLTPTFNTSPPSGGSVKVEMVQVPKGGQIGT